MDQLTKEDQNQSETKTADKQEEATEIELEEAENETVSPKMQGDNSLAEGYVADETAEEDGDEEVEGRPYVLMALCALGLVLVISLGLLFYRYAPLNAKIAGTWRGESVGALYKIENQQDDTTFTMLDSNGMAGVDMVFKSKLTKEGANEYFVKDTKVFLRLNAELLGEELIKTYAENKEMFRVVEDTQKSLLLEYTKAGKVAAFGDKDLDTLFKYVLRDFKWSKMGSDNLNLRNDLFASGGITFKREK